MEEMPCLLERHKHMNKLKSYAQIGQDLIAFDFFRFYPTTDRIFLDVGAFDGIGFSNSRLLFEKGWSGVCIEPVLKNYAKLESLYKNTNVITIQAAASDYKGELVLNVATIPWAEDWGSDVSSPSDDAVQRWSDYIWEKEVVTATTINTILEDNNVKRVDFVSIDVEGFEIMVLRGFDLQKYTPSLLVIEYSTLRERQELITYMNSHGYISWIDNWQDIFFIRKPVLRDFKIFFYGIYQQIKFSKLGQFIAKIIRRFK